MKATLISQIARAIVKHDGAVHGPEEFKHLKGQLARMDDSALKDLHKALKPRKQRGKKSHVPKMASRKK